jgi:hypothetical protein
MTICEPFRFWTNEMRVTNVIRERCFRLILACVVCTLLVTMESHPANAAVADPSAPADEADRFSMECLMATGASGDETLKILFDPHTTDVFRIHLKLSFDPTQFKLDPSQSGPFCSFADGGMPCPQRPPVELGKKTEIPQIAPSSESGISEKRIARERFVKDNTFNPGIPPPGSILSFSEPTSGHVVVDYILPAPVNLSIDQIVFALAFRVINPPRKRLFATYFGTPPEAQTPGAVRFNLLESSCNGGAIRCIGQPAIEAFDIQLQ